MNKTPHGIREDFSREPLKRENLFENPFDQFKSWFDESCSVDPDAPNAISLATASSDNIPSIRTVLLKFFDERGFVFFTNYKSKKGRDLEENPRAAILFSWLKQGRQIIASGNVEKISSEESNDYFQSRSPGSRLGAWASNQSSVIKSRSELESSLRELENRFKNDFIPLPSFWGGYRLSPDNIEFWQGQSDRLHDRFSYFLLDNATWDIQRLAP